MRFQTGLILALTTSALAAPTLMPYTNARFGFTVQVPNGLTPQAPPANGDGRTWQSQDGQVEVRAYGSHLPGVLGERSIRQIMQRTREDIVQDGGTITYAAEQVNAFVLSGYARDGRIYYQRTLLRAGQSATLLITYPVQQRASWNTLVGDLSRSLHWTAR